MKRWGAVCLLVVLPTLSSAQLVKKSKAAKPATTPVPTVAPTPTAPVIPSPPFDMSWDSIPSTFRPDGFEQVFAANEVVPKDEFETDAQYRARIAVDAAKVYAFSIDKAVAFTYNADLQQFEVPFLISESITGVRDETGAQLGAKTFYPVFVVISDERESGPDTTGTNGFGAKVTISHVTERTRGVVVSSSESRYPSQWLDLYRTFEQDRAIPMPTEEARVSKKDLAALVAFRLRAGFDGRASTTGTSYSGATFDAPVALLQKLRLLSGSDVTLVFYNRANGKILKRRKL